MKNEDEFLEGKKDASADKIKNIIRNITNYSDNYKEGYFSVMSIEKKSDDIDKKIDKKDKGK